MSHYRDPLAGLLSQVATKRAVLESRAREVSPMVLALLPEELRASIEELRPRALARAETMESLAAADAALDALLERYDAAAAKAPSLREADAGVSDPAPPRMPPPWLFEEPTLLRLRDRIEERVKAIDEDARVSRYGDRAYVARFHHEGPFSFVVAAGVMTDDSLSTAYECFLRTSVPSALPSLELRREGLAQAALRALHWARELEIGDPPFDSLFWITGSRHATAVLTPDVRSALIRLEAQHPVLYVGDSMTTLSWKATWGSVPANILPVPALDVLVGIRRAVERD